jgi:NAD(P) transhydrogenase
LDNGGRRHKLSPRYPNESLADHTMPANHYDLVVIGSGPAGEKGAVHAAQLGKRVALIEKEHVLGGVAANKGSLLSKTLRETALALIGFRQRGLQGVTMTLKEQVNASDFLNRERLVRQLEQARIRAQLERHRVTLITGAASFVDAHTVSIATNDTPRQEEILTGSVILLAVGSHPYRPPIFPAGHPQVFDSDSIANLRELPQQMVVAGSGVVGCEYACMFAALGVKTTLIEEDDRLLPFLDGEVSAALLASLRGQGIDVRLGERVTAVARGSGFGLTLDSKIQLYCDTLLVAAGREGNTASLNLAAVGLATDARGLLAVNAHFQTGRPHVYAAGDVVGFPALASSAMEQARSAMAHAFDSNFQTRSGPVLPYGIYTIPECAMAGDTEQALQGKGVPFVAGVAHYAGNARGQIIGAREGFLKLIFHRETMQLLGVHIIGELASELVHTGSVALQKNAGAELFTQACFNYPTLGELYKSATYDALAKRTPVSKLPMALKPPAR